MRTLDPYYTYQPTSTDTWQTIDLSSELEATDIAVWILISGNPSSGTQDRGVRHPSHTGTWITSASTTSHTWSVLRFLNSSQELDFYGSSGSDKTTFTIIAAFTADDLTLYDNHPTEYTYDQPPSGRGNTYCNGWLLTDRLPSGTSPTVAFVNWENDESGLYQLRAVSDDNTTGCSQKRSFVHPQTMFMGIDGSDYGYLYISD